MVWEGADEWLQVVKRNVAVPVEYHDWTRLSETRRREELDQLLERDRAAGLDLGTAPLMLSVGVSTGSLIIGVGSGVVVGRVFRLMGPG